ncbi:hypothetical protein JR316_0011671 [Psilocybe cubensis]|uniref:Uncharacterized protein n=2 Tax=Psilocybe cubensis TaxID=181762 RepID=A0ACB8GKN6_PSICU|nr:hypothetical protein JR316_0011671 [Psilocybe cubensis]KAH9476101.1 hypothetical protein JR316_0011671 [Psilocybe cubensis]
MALNTSAVVVPNPPPDSDPYYISMRPSYNINDQTYLRERERLVVVKERLEDLKIRWDLFDDINKIKYVQESTAVRVVDRRSRLHESPTVDTLIHRYAEYRVETILPIECLMVHQESTVLQYIVAHSDLEEVKPLEDTRDRKYSVEWDCLLAKIVKVYRSTSSFG